MKKDGLILLIVIIIFSIWIFTPIETQVVSDAYCENLFFKPNAIERMNQVGCDLQEVNQRILDIKKGNY